ncbi:hypothetical protein L249_7250 [Ophiocordyceps polyrhachis-furcata BCC 54312]|uniref:Uncharacterized protein n=1 Tax=Ophiocordyceps polyrhachis-furcata BCC 54312 TaxID=1330021 RepID=A0A367LAX5_9HYPO|nr:hypothetical protein L249_7250 [Ophiocordyceps polyrhachis-furcata BCC 54312]
MLFLNAALLGSLVASTSALSLSRPSRRSLGHGDGAKKAFEPLDIGVHVHIMASPAETQISDHAVENQVRIMNDNFAQIDISFHVESVERVIDASWASGLDDNGMKWENNKGNGTALNLYIVEEFVKWNRTVGTFRSMAHLTKDPYGYRVDGVVLSQLAVPLSPRWDPEGPYEGKQAAKKIAAWFGLPSVMRSSCDSTVDLIGRPAVLDIPAAIRIRPRERKAGGCQVGRNTCPDQPGVDPIHNFVFGSDESCAREFSPGQGERIRQMWSKTRVGRKVFGPDTEWLPVLNTTTAEGKKPFYIDVSDAAASKFCQPDRFGVTAVKDESRCGSFYYCTWMRNHEESRDQPRCLAARADPPFEEDDFFY